MGAVIVIALSQVMIEYLSLYYHQTGVSTRLVPVLMAGGNLLGAISFWTLHSWEKYLDRYKLALLIVVTALFVLSFQAGLIAGCAGVLLFTRFLRVLQVQFESRIQHLANEEARATISSIASFIATALAAGIAAAIGLLAVGDVILQPLRLLLVAGAVLFGIIYVVTRQRQAVPAAEARS
jgi:hypothetical protein